MAANKCAIDSVYPFMFTRETALVCMDGLENNPPVGAKNCKDCAWLGFPCTFAMDLLTCLPFAGIYACNKCNKTYCTQNVAEDVITTQPTNQ